MFKKHQRGSTLFDLLVMLFWLVMICGWITNIYKLIHYDTSLGFTVLVAVRLIGIFTFFPGAIAGFF